MKDGYYVNYWGITGNHRWLNEWTFGIDEEIEYWLEFDLDRPGLTNDWSFTAWGENGSVQVTVDGKTSDDFPLLAMDDTSLPPNEGGVGDETDPNDQVA